MNEDLNPKISDENAEDATKQPEIVVNEYGTTRDSAVVVEEENRTVLLTEDETIIIDKSPKIDIAPKNRPRKVYAGMWGQSEIATVGLGLLAILAVVILVVLVVLPAQKELEKNKAERDRLETELMSARNKYGTITTTEARVAELMTSVNDFETRFLPVATIGRTSLYQRINGLIGAYGLVNTTGPDFAPLEISGSNRRQESEAERGRTKFQSLFPGVYATMTLEGSYQNLRRFIREIETGNNFVVISAVELGPAENDEKDKQTQTGVTRASIDTVKINPNDAAGLPQGPATVQTVPQAQTITATKKAVRGKTHGETVSLRLEMAAYFRRPNFRPIETVTESQ
ncbi:MAG: hypothetical protein LC778_00590 [Acidobacteria bacterium]|nr:hypothetical protein [Acidobacteriota bacterium]